MKYTVEMASGGMIYILSLIQIGSVTQKFLEGGGIQMQGRTHAYTDNKVIS
jgi:hypothetical protein